MLPSSRTMIHAFQKAAKGNDTPLAKRVKARAAMIYNQHKATKAGA